MTFRDRLYELRNQRQWSQELLGEMIGVDPKVIDDWERGLSEPGLDLVMELSEVFHVPTDYLLGKTAQAYPDKESFTDPTHKEYKSSTTVMGLPLVHINSGQGANYKAKGIIAIGNMASGVVSIGGFSRGIFSIGGMSMGVFSFGGMSLGLVSLGGLSAGGLALGAMALGYMAIGSIALGVYAIGLFAIAIKAAFGLTAMAHLAIGQEPKGKYVVDLIGENDQMLELGKEQLKELIRQEAPHMPKLMKAIVMSMAKK